MPEINIRTSNILCEIDWKVIKTLHEEIFKAKCNNLIEVGIVIERTLPTLKNKDYKATYHNNNLIIIYNCMNNGHWSIISVK